jgi:hypothetical protein
MGDPDSARTKSGAGARTRTADRRVLPYTFAAPGTISGGNGTTLHVGGGFDTIVWQGIGAGAEIGYVGPFPKAFDYGIGVLSVNTSYQFVPVAERHRLSPFVTAG